MRERRIYIMPTGRGLAFLVLIVINVLTASVYNNNLIFILGFFLFALFVVSMLQTHDNLREVELAYAGATGAFAGEPLTLSVRLSHKGKRDVRGLVVRTTKGDLRTVEPGHADLPAAESAVRARVSVVAERRGVFAPGRVILETRYPHGLFRAWIVTRPAGEVFVYPRPAGGLTLEPAGERAGEGDGLGNEGAPDGDFGELRPHRPGESYHRVAWKHFARTGALYQRAHWGAARPHYVIPWLGDDEAALAQVSAWVERARDAGASFELPNQGLGPGVGDDLAHACWRALARAGRR